MQKHLDERALQKYLDGEQYSTKGIILRLAWREGLSRSELCSLKWSQVDFEEKLLRLPSRSVPLEDETAACLRQFHLLYERSPFVVVSDWTGKPLVPQGLSRIASAALKEAGMSGLNLRDLRTDYIVRQFETHDWPYAVQVTGLSIATYRQCFTGYNRERDASTFEPITRDAKAEEKRLEKLLREQRTDNAVVALWLAKEAGLRLREIADLTWDRIDFEHNVLSSNSRAVPLSAELRDVLAELNAIRLPDADPHVILSPRARKPLPASRLSALVRDALIHAGIGGAKLSDFNSRKQREDARTAIMAYLSRHGSISRQETCELLSIGKAAAYDRLQTLTEDGTLVLKNKRYYPSEAVIADDDCADAILRYVNSREGGAISIEEAAELLRIGKRKAKRILTGMTKDGYLFANYDAQTYMARGRFYKRNES